jgi:hypothetical protein
MDANFSLKRISRKIDLEAYDVEEERRVCVRQEEVDSVAIEDKEFKNATKKKGKRSADTKVYSLLTFTHHIFQN